MSVPNCAVAPLIQTAFGAPPQLVCWRVVPQFVSGACTALELSRDYDRTCQGIDTSERSSGGAIGYGRRTCQSAAPGNSGRPSPCASSWQVSAGYR
jgi:hypothetical protein